MIPKQARLFSPSIRMVICIPSGSTEVEIRAVRDSSEHAGGRDEYEPYNYSDEYGKRIGIDAEIATEACRRMGMKPVFVSIKWDEKDELLEEKQIDCAWNCFSMNDLKDAYQWAGPYLTSREMVVDAKDSSIKSIKDLDGKIVGVQTSTQPETIFTEKEKGIPDVKFVYSFPDMEDALMVLQQGYVDACRSF